MSTSTYGLPQIEDHEVIDRFKRAEAIYAGRKLDPVQQAYASCHIPEPLWGVMELMQIQVNLFHGSAAEKDSRYRMRFKRQCRGQIVAIEVGMDRIEGFLEATEADWRSWVEQLMIYGETGSVDPGPDQVL